MALTLLGPRRPLLVLILLLSLFLGGPGCLAGELSCYKGFVKTGTDYPADVKCLQNYYTHSVGCAQIIVKNTGATVLDLLDCQEATEENLKCFKDKGAAVGITNKGNCFFGTYGAFEKMRAECNIGPRTVAPDPKPHDDDTFTLCNCNEIHHCNRVGTTNLEAFCECVDTEGLCGEKPCDKPKPSYQCHCEGVPPKIEEASAAKCVDGKRFCDKALSSKETCFSYAAQDGDKLKVYKDCLSAAEYTLLSTCVLKQFKWKDKCASGSTGEYNHALEGCTKQSPAKAGKVQGIPGLGDKIPVTVCPCEGNLCNAGAITVSTSKQSRKNKNGGGRIGGQGIRALGAVAMMVVMLKEGNWK